MKLTKKLILLTLLSIIAVFAYFYIEDRLWHPLKIPGLQNDLLNESFGDIKIESRVDFIGMDIHGGHFDFYKYHINLSNFTSDEIEKRLVNYPKFLIPLFSKDTVGEITEQQWAMTPLTGRNKDNIESILRFTNFIDDKDSQKFIESDYFTKEGNYYAFYGGYPVGNYILLITPKENTFYIIRKNG